MSAEQTRIRPGRGRRLLLALLQGALPLAVLAGAGAGVYALMASDSSTERAPERSEPARLVETVAVDRGEHTAAVQAWGEVIPADEVQVAPRVGGEIVEVADDLEAGGRVRKGQVVARIDDSDYKVALRQAKTQLAKAKAALADRARQPESRRDGGELLNQELSEQERDLVLRQPQLQQARAEVDSAEAAVEDAQLDLTRTEVRAPFDAVVRSVSIDVGSQVAAGQHDRAVDRHRPLFRRTRRAPAKLRWIEARQEGPSSGSRVELANPSVWGEGRTRTGEVVRVRPDLSEQGRMARVLVEVTDPLDREPPMLVGSYLRGRIMGRAEPGRRPRPRLPARGRQRLGDDRKRIGWKSARSRSPTAGPEKVYVSVGLGDGERVVTSDIATPPTA